MYNKLRVKKVVKLEKLMQDILRTKKRIKRSRKRGSKKKGRFGIKELGI